MQPFRGDDWQYLWWSRETGLLELFATPPPYPYLRPGNALVWWFQGRLAGAEPWWIRGALFLSLFGILAGIGATVARRVREEGREAGTAGLALGLGALAMGLALQLGALRNLVFWSSWMTTAGSLCGSLWALELRARKRNTAGVVALLLAVSFKEIAWLHIALVSAGRRDRWWAPMALAGCAIHLALTPNASQLSLAHVAGHLPSLGGYLVEAVWPLPLLGLALWGARRWPRGLIEAGCALACIAPALGFYLWNPTYLLEGSVFLLLATLPLLSGLGWRALARPGGAVGLWLMAGLLVVRAALADGEDRGWHATQQREARHLVRRAQEVGAVTVWSPEPGPSACGVAAEWLVFEGVAWSEDRAATPVELSPCLFVAGR